MKIEEMVAGPALDALVAEKVMGWKLGKLYPSSSADYWVDAAGNVTNYRTPKCKDRELDIFAPSIHIASAWEVVDRLKAILTDRHVAPSWPIERIEITWDGVTNRWGVFIPNLANEHASELPMAICRAALKAVGA